MKCILGFHDNEAIITKIKAFFATSLYLPVAANNGDSLVSSSGYGSDILWSTISVLKNGKMVL